MTKMTQDARICKNCKFKIASTSQSNPYNRCSKHDFDIDALDISCCFFTYSKAFYMSLWEPVANALVTDYDHSDEDIQPFSSEAIEMLLDFMFEHATKGLQYTTEDGKFDTQNGKLYMTKNTYGFDPNR